MSRFKSRWILFIGAMGYAIAIQFCYSVVISPVYRYEGYVCGSPTFAVRVLLTSTALIPILWMPLSVTRPSQFVYWILYVLVFIPSSVIPFYSLSIEPIENIFFFVLVLLLSFMVLGLFQRINMLPIKRFALPGIVFWAGISLLALSFYSLLFHVYGFPTSLESFRNVYQVRSHYSQLESSNTVIGYCVNWLGNVLNPIFMVYGLLNRKLLLLLTGILGQVVVYGVTGYKSVLLSGLILVALLFALKRHGQHFGLRVMWGFVIIVVLGITCGIFFHAPFTAFLLVGRPIITPGLLTGYYYDFFSQHPKALLGHSIFRFLVQYPYGTTPPYLIGSTYFQGSAVDANGNIWCDAFANFGDVGILLFTILLGALLLVFDSMAQGENCRIGILLLGVPAFTLANAGLLTSLLTHGIGLVFLLYYLRPRQLMSYHEKKPSSMEKSAPLFGKTEFYLHERRRI